MGLRYWAQKQGQQDRMYRLSQLNEIIQISGFFISLYERTSQDELFQKARIILERTFSHVNFSKEISRFCMFSAYPPIKQLIASNYLPRHHTTLTRNIFQESPCLRRNRGGSS